MFINFGNSQSKYALLVSFRASKFIFIAIFPVHYAYLDPYVYCFLQIFHPIRLFGPVRLFGTLKYASISKY